MSHNLASTVSRMGFRAKRDAPPGPPKDLTTLVEIARWRAETQAEQMAFTFLADGEREAGTLTYGALDRRARAIATELQMRRAQGQRVLLLLEPGLDFVAALYGCLYAGTLAVPVNPPDPLRLSRTLPRLEAVVHDAGARFFLGTREILQCVQNSSGNSFHPEFVALESVDDDSAELWQPIAADDQAAALLQYTSGSTDVPRGILLTHANLRHSLAGMHREDIDDVVGVTWLPPYHDFGLIGGTLLPVYSGRRTVLMSPLSFVERPLRWLQAISRYRGTTSGGPNFAYELCVRKHRPNECVDLDLSSWKIAVVGAEPVRAETLDRFAETFAPYGFRRETFLPAYGLAEAVLNVTSGRWFDLPVVRSFSRQALADNRVTPSNGHPNDACRLVGCGRPWAGDRVAVVDLQSEREVEAGTVGEIWVQSPNVGKGYWNRPEETSRVFRAHLNGDGEGEFLRTGDLGFFHEGELFVVGRLKELIVLHGRNYYPHDIEQVVSRAHPALRPNEGVAFSCDIQGQERLIVVQEARRSSRYRLEDVIQAIRRELAEEFLLLPHAVALIAGGTLPKTSSGKPRRRTVREQFIQGKLDSLIQWRAEPCCDPAAARAEYLAPRSPLEQELAAIWAEVLHVERVGVHDNFFALGGNSLLATELYSRMRRLLPAELPLGRLFEQPTIAGLAELILAAQVGQDSSDDLAHLLNRLETMTDDEAARILPDGRVH